jgi:hypothetical protein
MKKKAPKYLTLQQLCESTHLAYQVPIPPKASLEYQNYLRERILTEIDLFTYDIGDPNTLPEELAPIVKALIDVSVYRLFAKSNPEDAAYLAEWKKQSVRPVKWSPPENPEPIAEFPDPCPKCGNHGAYLDIFRRPDNPVDPKNPPMRCCGCHERRDAGW